MVSNISVDLIEDEGGVWWDFIKDVGRGGRRESRETALAKMASGAYDVIRL